MDQVELKITESVSVVVEIGTEKAYSYTVISQGKEVVAYETSADIRNPAGRIGVRNVVFRNVDDCSKEAAEESIQNELARNKEDLNHLLR
ncbi:hypothetical protein [Natronorubrum sp. DTA7]|uniref:hypothetical protein n=1 Tax=Natronorubrum sp. DTA7 TaxID=3447016 RepID=UPI003F84CF34